MYDLFGFFRDKQKWTALFYAAEHGHIETMEILLAAGADIKGKDTKQVLDQSDAYMRWKSNHHWFR